MRKIFCDICGAEVKEAASTNSTLFFKVEEVGAGVMVFKGESEVERDICVPCIIKYLANHAGILR